MGKHSPDHWKTNRKKRSWWSRLDDKYIEFDPSTAPIKVAILLGVILLAVIVGSYGYYTSQVAPNQNGFVGGQCLAPNQVIGGVCKVDPFAAFWSGQIGQLATSTPTLDNHLMATTTSTTLSQTFTAIGGDQLVACASLVYTFSGGSGATGNSAASDTKGNVYTLMATGRWTHTIVGPTSTTYDMECWNAPMTAGSDTVSINLATLTPTPPNCTVNSCHLWLYEYSHAGVPTATASGAEFTLNGESGAINLPTSYYGNPQLLGISFDTNCCHNLETGYTYYGSPFTSSGGGYSWQAFAGSASVGVQNPTNYHQDCNDFCFWVEAGIVIPYSSPTLTACDPYYKCINTTTEGDNMNLHPINGTAAIALSTAAIDLSPCSAKPCGFAMQNYSPTGHYSIGERFAWYLTINGTLPTQPNYNPLTDPNVVMAVYEIEGATSTGNTTSAVYVFIQRQAGIPMIPPGSSDDLGVFSSTVTANYAVDPYATTNCPGATSLFICHKSPHDGGFGGSTTNTNLMGLELNFTGGGTPSSQICFGSSPTVPCGGPATSYICDGIQGAGVGNDCLMGGFSGPSGTTQVTYSAFMGFSSNLPGLSFQNSYHVGFWEMANNTASLNPAQPGISFITSAGSNSPIISYFVPPAQQTSATQDTGGFFGWVARGLGQAWQVVSGVGSAIWNGVLQPALGLGNSLMNAFIGALVQAGQLMSTAFALLFNAIGSLWGDGHLGTDLVNFFSSIVTLIATFFINIGSLIVSAVLAVVDFFEFIGLVVGGFFLTILHFIEKWLQGGLLEEVLTLLGYMALSLQIIVLFDLLIGTLAVVVSVRAWVQWINFNIWIATAFFRLFYWFFDQILKIISRLRTTGPRPLGL